MSKKCEDCLYYGNCHSVEEVCGFYLSCDDACDDDCADEEIEERRAEFEKEWAQYTEKFYD